MSARYTSKEIAEAIKGEFFSDFSVSSVVIDSRRVGQGSLFVALKGERFDGHNFVSKALEDGASGALVSSKIPEADIKKLVIVDDVFEALNKLGEYARNKSSAKFIGITGSVGKTSVKEAAALAFSALGKTFWSEGNYNNHIGVPLNLANLASDAKFAVIEMGMNHAGEIDALTRLARPHVAVITNVEPAHLEFFGTLQGIADAKAEIFNGVEKGGVAVLNSDNQFYEHLVLKAKELGIENIISFGCTEKADVKLVEWLPDNAGSNVTVEIRGKAYKYKIGARQRHQALNTLPALAAVYALGFDVAKAANNLADFAESEGRGSAKVIKLNGKQITLIDDSYNASPASMKAALTGLKLLENKGDGKTVVVLGDMLELGETSPELHADLARDVISGGANVLVTSGKYMKNLHEALKGSVSAEHFESYKDIPEFLRENLSDGDVLLVKGSHGSNMYKVVEELLKTKEVKQGKEVAV